MYGHAGWLANLPTCPCGAVAKFTDPDPICGPCYRGRSTRRGAYAAGFLAGIHNLTTARPELRGIGFADLAAEVTA